MINVSKRLFWTTVGTGAISVATIIALLLWITTMTNEIAAVETEKRVQAALDILIERNGLLTADYAQWTSAWEWYRDGDEEALYENLGSGASDSDTFDLIYFVAADGTPTHAYGEGYDYSELALYNGDIGATALSAFGAPPLDDYATTSDLVPFNDDIAIVTTSRIQPDDYAHLSATDLPFMIGINLLSAEQLGRSLFLDGLNIVSLETADDIGYSNHLLRGPDGTPMAKLVWRTSLPGQALLKVVAPVVALLALLLMLGSWIVGRLAAKQTDAYLRERVSARTDPVTGLLNRTGLLDASQSNEMNTHFSEGHIALIYIDLNGLKALNDAFGHKVGDAAIIATAKRLRASVRSNDRIARIGGDEFVCMIVDRDPRVAATLVANRIATLTSEDFTFETGSFSARASIGIAFSADAKTWDSLLSHADQAMYFAKRDKREKPVMFKPSAFAPT